jgi:alpha-tubulin suppressor-like RCC1 family protein
MANTYTCALSTNNEVYCWGSPFNAAVDLGPNVSDADKPTKIMVDGDPLTFDAIEAGRGQMCGLTNGEGDNGIIECWGTGSDGRLGNGSTDSPSTPVTVSCVRP